MLKSHALPLACLLTCLLGSCQPKSILMSLLHSGPSHQTIFLRVARELSRKGHQIHILTPIPVTEEIENVTVVLVEGNRRLHMKLRFEKVILKLKVPRTLLQALRSRISLLDMDLKVCEVSLQQETVKRVMSRESGFDLVIQDMFTNFCSWVLLKNMGVPLVFLSTASPYNYYLRGIGASTLPSFNPNIMFAFDDGMSFLDRLQNFILDVFNHLYLRFTILPTIKSYFKLYRNESLDVNDLFDLQGNASLFLINQHHSFEYSRSLLPNMVEIGGIHLQEPRPLSQDLEQFVQRSNGSGWIYFSFGTVFPTERSKEELLASLLEAFRALPFQVVMKWDRDLDDLPPNVRLVRWVSQQDILGHPSIKAFVTHGGLLSTHEAVYHGVPVVVIPLFEDQNFNAHLIMRHGLGERIDLYDLEPERLRESIIRVAGSRDYRKNLERVSRRFRESSAQSSRKAVFWIEYILRHRGAFHIRHPSRYVSWFQYYLVDVFLLTLVILAGGAFVLVRAGAWLAKRATTAWAGSGWKPPAAVTRLIIK